MARRKAMSRSEFAYFASLQTRWNDNDEFGHLYNVVYLELFDNAMNGWLMERGMLDYKGETPIPVVAESACSYLSEVSYPDVVDIGTRLTRMGKTSFDLTLGMFREGSDATAAIATFTLVFVSPDTHKPQRPPEHFLKAMEQLA